MQIFKKSIVELLCIEKRILGMGGQNQVKVTKGHQVQIFKKHIFERLCREKAFGAS